MSKLEELITQIIDKKKRLDALREQSPEIAEALALADLYHGQMNDLREMCNPAPQIMPMPYPVYPPPIWEPYKITCSDTTASTTSTIRLIK